MRPALRWASIALACAVVLLAAAFSPRALRRMDAFGVGRVEVVGTRYLAPHEVLRQSGIAHGDNVFDDPEPWRLRLLAHPLVADVVIDRRLPGTVRIVVTEKRPVALVRTPLLRAVDRTGFVLPIETADAALDLPVISVPTGVAADGRLSSRLALEMVRKLDRLRRLDPALARLVSELEPARDGVRLRLRRPAPIEALLPPNPDRTRLDRLRRTLHDLAARGELAAARRIDARYRGQVVVSLNPNTGS